MAGGRFVVQFGKWWKWCEVGKYLKRWRHGRSTHGWSNINNQLNDLNSIIQWQLEPLLETLLDGLMLAAAYCGSKRLTRVVFVQPLNSFWTHYMLASPSLNSLNFLVSSFSFYILVFLWHTDRTNWPTHSADHWTHDTTAALTCVLSLWSDDFSQFNQ